MLSSIEFALMCSPPTGKGSQGSAAAMKKIPLAGRHQLRVTGRPMPGSEIQPRKSDVGTTTGPGPESKPPFSEEKTEAQRGGRSKSLTQGHDLESYKP